MNKAELARLALELRAEVGLGPTDPFDPHVLASLYGVPVIPLSALECRPEVLRHFTTDRPEVFSGALIPCTDGSTVIVENDSHEPERRVSTASHEVAHVVLEHPFTPTLTDRKGCRVAVPEHEKEAAELSGELLLPTTTARTFALARHADDEVAGQLGISIEMARWRMNATGARRYAERAHAKRHRNRT